MEYLFHLILASWQPILYFFLAFWLTMQLTFICYLGIMNAMKNRDKISKAAWVFIGPLALVGVTLDCLLSVTFMTVMFADLPREFLLTSRLHRYRDQPQYEGTKRRKAAAWICENLLNAFDPDGKHC